MCTRLRASAIYVLQLPYLCMWIFANYCMGLYILLCSYLHKTYAELVQKKLSVSCTVYGYAYTSFVQAVIAYHDIVALYERVNCIYSTIYLF